MPFQNESILYLIYYTTFPLYYSTLMRKYRMKTAVGERVDTLEETDLTINSSIEQLQAKDTKIDESITALQAKDVELENREDDLEARENNLDTLWGYLRMKR